MATIEIPPTFIPNFLASCEDLTAALRANISEVTPMQESRQVGAKAVLHAVENIEIPFNDLVGADGRITLYGAVLLTRWINQRGLAPDYSGDDPDDHK